MKRIVLALGILLVVGVVAVWLLARFVFTGDNVRTAIAAQVSQAIGQPVSIADLGVSVYPKVTVDLSGVTIGEPATLQLGSVHLETGLRALLSRRIERAAVRIDGAKVTLPLPNLGTAGAKPSPQASSEKPPVEIVSIDEIVLRGVEVTSGDRTLRGDIELVPQGTTGVQIRRLSLSADETTLEITGAITSFAPVAGEVDVKATAIDFDRLIAFLTDFSGAAADPAAPAVAPGAELTGTGLDGRLKMTLSIGRATTGGLTLSDLRATTHVTDRAVSFEPLSFGIFGGRYEGTMKLALAETPTYQWEAKVNGIDTASLMAFGGSPGTVTGTLSGTVALQGAGLEMERALRSARGVARIEIANGTIAGLALVRTVVTAASGRGGLLTSVSNAAAGGQSAGSERFSRLGATLAIADGHLRTDDFAMTSPDVDLTAAGGVNLASMMTQFAGRVQLSEALSKEAGTDLYRTTQENGRVTLPVTLSGPIDAISARVDIKDAAVRALKNRAADEAKKAIERNIPSGLRGLLKKPKGGG